MTISLVELRDLQQIYLQRANASAGTPEAVDYLLHARRFRMIAEEMERLQTENAECQRERDEAEAQAQILRMDFATNTALAVQVVTMREALEKVVEKPKSHEASRIATQVLALSTKPASEVLAEFEKKVIERCIGIVRAFKGLGYRDDGSDAWKGHDNAVTSIEAALLALIAAPKENSNG